MGQGEIGDPHIIEEPQALQDDDDGDDNEVIAGCRQTPVQVEVDPNDDNEGMDESEPQIDDDNNDQVPGDPAGGKHGPRGLRCGCGPKGSQRIETAAPIFMNLHVNAQSFQQRIIKMFKVTFSASMTG